MTHRTMTLCAVSGIIALSLGLAPSCKPKAQGGAFAAFVIGTATLTRPGETARPLRHRDALRAGDSIATGPDSMVVVQIGAEATVKLEANTAVRVAALLDQGKTSVDLERGTLITGVRKLQKNAVWEVRTQTSLAAVRGTRFSVKSDAGRSIVAVDEGTVSVKQTAGAGEEKAVEKGNAAEVAAAITTRPVTADEKKEFEKFARVPVLEDAGKLDEAELRKMEQKYLEDTGEKKEEKEDDKITDASEVKDDGAGAARVWTGKRLYQAGETISVFYKNLPENRYCWISIEKASAAPGAQESYNWTYSAKEGRMDFSGLSLEPGPYEARVHFKRGNAVDLRVPFTVQ